jgi:hypothetical protein
VRTRKRTGLRTATLVALVLVVALTAVAVAGCGRGEFKAGSTPDVTAAVAKAGAVVLDQGTAKNYYPGGKQARWYAVGKEGSDTPSAVVSVFTFDSQQTRDAAARDLDNARRAGSRVEAVYTAGDAVILVNQIDDTATVQALDKALREAGLK